MKTFTAGFTQRRRGSGERGGRSGPIFHRRLERFVFCFWNPGVAEYGSANAAANRSLARAEAKNQKKDRDWRVKGMDPSAAAVFSASAASLRATWFGLR